LVAIAVALAVCLTLEKATMVAPDKI